MDVKGNVMHATIFKKTVGKEEAEKTEEMTVNITPVKLGIIKRTLTGMGKCTRLAVVRDKDEDSSSSNNMDIDSDNSTAKKNEKENSKDSSGLFHRNNTIKKSLKIPPKSTLKDNVRNTNDEKIKTVENIIHSTEPISQSKTNDFFFKDTVINQENALKKDVKELKKKGLENNIINFNLKEWEHKKKEVFESNNIETLKFMITKNQNEISITNQINTDVYLKQRNMKLEQKNDDKIIISCHHSNNISSLIKNCSSLITINDEIVLNIAEKEIKNASIKREKSVSFVGSSASNIIENDNGNNNYKNSKSNTFESYANKESKIKGCNSYNISNKEQIQKQDNDQQSKKKKENGYKSANSNTDVDVNSDYDNDHENHKNEIVLILNGKSYLRLNVLGKGGSSCVYRVMSKSDSQLYAYKRVELKGTNDDSDAVFDSYTNEINLLKKLQGTSPYIINLIDAEINRSEMFIAMVMEAGEVDLNKVLSQKQKNVITTTNSHFLKNLNKGGIGSLNAKKDFCENNELLNPFFARMVWQEMLEAVDHIHKHRIVHGDLKPANFVFVRGHLKLIDFGIAKAFSNDTTNIYRENQIGTVNYMAPEAIAPYLDIYDQNDSDTDEDNAENKKERRLRGDRGVKKIVHEGMSMRLGRASDVWSLGCILYQMIFGHPPFASLTTIQKLHAIPNPKCVIQYPENEGYYFDMNAVKSIKKCLKRNPIKRAVIKGEKGLLSMPYLSTRAMYTCNECNKNNENSDNNNTDDNKRKKNEVVFKKLIENVLQIVSEFEKENNDDGNKNEGKMTTNDKRQQDNFLCEKIRKFLKSAEEKIKNKEISKRNNNRIMNIDENISSRKDDCSKNDSDIDSDLVTMKLLEFSVSVALSNNTNNSLQTIVMDKFASSDSNKSANYNTKVINDSTDYVELEEDNHETKKLPLHLSLPLGLSLPLSVSLLVLNASNANTVRDTSGPCTGVVSTNKLIISDNCPAVQIPDVEIPNDTAAVGILENCSRENDQKNNSDEENKQTKEMFIDKNTKVLSIENQQIIVCNPLQPMPITLQDQIFGEQRALDNSSVSELAERWMKPKDLTFERTDMSSIMEKRFCAMRKFMDTEQDDTMTGTTDFIEGNSFF